MGQLATTDELEIAREIRRQIATAEGSRDLIELGAHQRGVNTLLDSAVDKSQVGRRALADTT